MPYHLYPLAAMSLAGLDAEEAFRLCSAPDFLKADFVLEQFETAVAEMRRREQTGGTEISVADLYATRGRERPVAHTVNHPMRHMAVAIANRILRCLGETAEVPDAGADYLPLPQIPLMPSVERALGLPPDKDRRFDTSGVPRPPRYYLTRLAAHYAAQPPEALRAHLRSSREAAGFLEKFAAAHSPAEWLRAALGERPAGRR